MAAQGAHKITEDFERELCRYTGAPYCVAVDNCCNAIFLSLMYEKINFWPADVPYTVSIPRHTYPGVAMEILHVGAKISFNYDLNENVMDSQFLQTEYRIGGTMVYDSALRFTAGMYRTNTMQCLSFTGPYKHLKLGKGGAILTDDEKAVKWLKKARFSGRAECSYHTDDFDTDPVIGWNMYMTPDVAARGLQMMPQFWDTNGRPKFNADLALPYPDLSRFSIFK